MIKNFQVVRGKQDGHVIFGLEKDNYVWRWNWKKGFWEKYAKIEIEEEEEN